MHIDIITLFPEMFAPLQHSIIQRAQKAGLVRILIHQLRDYATNKHHTVDDTPYGGGPGMVLKPEPLSAAIRAIGASQEPEAHVILTTPQGALLHQKRLEELSRMPRLMIICGHYEGVDQRVIDKYVHEEISVGDYVLTGGELPAMVLVDAVVRLRPGVIDAESLHHESFTHSLLDWPHYTRPRVFEGMEVPPVLTCGDHAAIERFRREEALRRTLERRPELLKSPLP